MWVVRVPPDAVTYGPFLTEEDARRWAKCNTVTDLEGIEHYVSELTSSWSEDEELPVLKQGTGQRSSAAGMVDWWPIKLHDEAKGAEWHVADAMSKEAGEVLVRACNEMELGPLLALQCRSSIGKPQKSYQRFLSDLKEWGDENGSFVNTWKGEGFELVHTGGGCTAWERYMDDAYILVTAYEDAGIPQDMDTKLTVGIYEQDDSGDMSDEWVAHEDFPNTLEGTLEAIAWAENTIDSTAEARPCQNCNHVWSLRVGCDCTMSDCPEDKRP